MFKIGFLFLYMGSIFLFPLTGFADSPRNLVEKGNRAYLEGKYDEAIEAYNQASVEKPESARIYFNKGTVFYKKEDYKAAKEAFEQAALKSQDLTLEADAKFNLGNCEYKEAERNMDSDLRKALETYGKSIRYYQEALELNPTLKDAAENIEITRLVMKSILDEIKKQEEAQKQKQAAADKLKELIERQQGLITQRNDVSDQLKQNKADESLLDQITDLAGRQKKVESETHDLKQNIESQKQSQNQQNPLASPHPSIPHLEEAEKAAAQASKKLDEKKVEAAAPDQEDTLEALKKALDAMNQENKGQCQNKNQNQQQNKQQQQQQQQQQQNKQQQNKQQQMSGEDQDNNQDNEEQKTMAQLPDDAENILDEEKENKNKRNLPAGSGYRGVDRDW